MESSDAGERLSLDACSKAKGEQDGSLVMGHPNLNNSGYIYIASLFNDHAAVHNQLFEHTCSSDVDASASRD